jgi:hypothetical protein
MITQEQLNARRTAANYIDNSTEYAAEMAEIRRLQEILTPRVVVPRPQTVTIPKDSRYLQQGESITDLLKRQSKEKLEKELVGKRRPDVIAFLEKMIAG